MATSRTVRESGLPLGVKQQEVRIRVTDGTRTRDVQDHNLALYQLSYSHHLFWRAIVFVPAGFTASPGGVNHQPFSSDITLAAGFFLTLPLAPRNVRP
jgi:hypothetical protein